MQIIPAINTPDFETAEKQIEQAAEFSDWVHLDITDGIFSPAQIWGSPEELKELVNSKQELGKINFEIHLMVSNPEGVIDAWLRTGLVKRVIVHLEAMTDSVYILAKCKKYGAEAMLAISPGTEVERLLAHKDDFNQFQILAVAPGWAGQKFNQKMIDKIKFLRKNMPNAIIEVDGGINAETAKLVKEAGADIAVSASYIFGSKNPKKAYEELQMATNIEQIATNHESAEGKILFKDLSYKLQGSFYEVRNQYGQHHKEKIYHNALKEKFDERGMKYQSEPHINVFSTSTGKKLGTYVPDFLAEDSVIVELKASPFTNKDMEMQLVEYLKSSKYELAYLVNFGEKEFRPRRYIHTKDRKSIMINS